MILWQAMPARIDNHLDIYIQKCPSTLTNVNILRNSDNQINKNHWQLAQYNPCSQALPIMFKYYCAIIYPLHKYNIPALLTLSLKETK